MPLMPVCRRRGRLWLKFECEDAVFLVEVWIDGGGCPELKRWGLNPDIDTLMPSSLGIHTISVSFSGAVVVCTAAC